MADRVINASDDALALIAHLLGLPREEAAMITSHIADAVLDAVETNNLEAEE